MGLLGRGWARENPGVKTLEEREVLTTIAHTAYEGDNAEINFPNLMHAAMTDEAGLRKVLNALAERGLILNIRPLNPDVPSYLCSLPDDAVDERHS